MGTFENLCQQDELCAEQRQCCVRGLDERAQQLEPERGGFHAVGTKVLGLLVVEHHEHGLHRSGLGDGNGVLGAPGQSSEAAKPRALEVCALDVVGDEGRELRQPALEPHDDGGALERPAQRCQGLEHGLV